MSFMPFVNTKIPECFDTHKALLSEHPSIMNKIYEDDINITIWQRGLSCDVENSVAEFLKFHADYQNSFITEPETVYDTLIKTESALINSNALFEDIATLVKKFCGLFNLKQARLQLSVFDYTMCPRFHVDRIPCRLLCSYNGAGSEWLPHEVVDRSKLSNGNNDLLDEVSGVYQSKQDIQQLGIGDVALLKGELWERNENAGLVHRSPQVPIGEKRLLLALDFTKFCRFGRSARINI